MSTQRSRHAPAPKERRAAGPLWPVQLAIFALAASIAALVMANGDFPNLRTILDGGWPRLARSSWLHLAADAVLLVVLLGAAPRLRGIGRRRTEFAVLLSLIAHFWLAVYLHHEYLPRVVAQSRDSQQTPGDPRDNAPLPDYHWRAVDAPDAVEEFQRPAPTLPSNPSQASRAEPKPTEAPSQAKLPRSAEPLPRPLPDKAEMSLPDMPQPERPESAVARLARHEAPADAPVQQAAMPAIRQSQPLTERALRPTAKAESTRRRDSVQPAGDARELPLAVPSQALADAAASPTRNDALDPLPLEQAAAPRRAAAPSARIDAEPADVPAVAASTESSERAAPELQARAMPADTAPAPARLSMPTLPGQPGQPGAESGATESAAVPVVDTVRERVARSATLRRDEPIASLRAASLPRSAVAGDAPSLGTSGLGALRIEEPMPLPAGAGGRSGGPQRIASGGSSDGDDAIRAASYVASSGNGNGRGALAGLTPSVDAEALQPRMPGGNGNGTSGVSTESVSREAALDDLPGGESVGGAAMPSGVTAGIPGRIPGSGAGSSRGLAMAKSGGVPSIDAGVTDTPAQMYLQRDPQRRGRMARSFGAGDDTEAAVELGIGYLLRHQFPDGRWAIDRFPQGNREGYAEASPGSMNADTAATGLALLAFLGAGYTHRDGKHKAEVRRAIDWLAAHQQADGRLGDQRTDTARFARLYGHAMAAIALCEAYGMTTDPALREPAQNAIRFIVASQHSELGGWRYTPGEESDTSVSGWKLMALRSAQIAGLEVPKESLVRVGKWLDAAQSDAGARYAYNPHASDTPEQVDGRRPSLAMTAEGLLMRMYLGWDRKQPALVQGAEWLSANPPTMGSADEPARDAYYWYYATQVMFQLQGNAWQQWNARMRPLLVESQQKTGPLAGSWRPDQPVPDRWSTAGGRHYVTTMHLLMLEVYYRHLPLYRLEAPAE